MKLKQEIVKAIVKMKFGFEAVTSQLASDFTEMKDSISKSYNFLKSKKDKESKDESNQCDFFSDSNVTVSENKGNRYIKKDGEDIIEKQLKMELDKEVIDELNIKGSVVFYLYTNGTVYRTTLTIKN